MGGFTLLKIKRRKGSLLRCRTRSAASAPAPAPDTCSAGPDEEDDEDDDASLTIAYEASCGDGGSTLSTIHTDSLTSFAGNLSPPEIELLDEFYRVVVTPNWSLGGLGRMARAQVRSQREGGLGGNGQEREEERQEREPGVAADGDGDGGRRDSPAALRCSTGSASSQKSSNSDSRVEAEGLEYSLSLASPPKSKSEDLAPPSKPKVAINPTAAASTTTLRTTIVGPSLPITSVPSVVTQLLEDFHPMAEVGWEINDEGNTVATQEVLEGLLPLQGKVAVGLCDFASSALAAHFACLQQACRGEAAGAAGAAADTVSMFDDEGNRHRLARTPAPAAARRGDGDLAPSAARRGEGDLAPSAGGSDTSPDSTAATMLEVYGSDGSEPESVVGRGRAARGPAADGTGRSDQVGREIAVEKRYRAGGCVMKHLNNLYDAHRRGQATGAAGGGGIHQTRSWTGDAARDGGPGSTERGPRPRRHEGRRSRSAEDRPLLPSLPEGAGGC